MSIKKAKLTNASILALLSAVMASSTSYAQVDEIVVTARKKTENLQTAPISITALSAETIETRQLFNVNEIAQYVPNLQYSSSAAGTASASSFSIRGIGQIDFISTTDSGVATYLDGVYLARVTGAALELADIERIEVLRGPQGTLFGRNTIGGAVSVVTRKPSGEFGFRGNLTAGNNGRIQGRAILDVPLAEDKLAGKFIVVGKTSNGYGTDLEPLGGSGDLGADDDIAGRAQLLFTPSDKVEFNVSAEYSTRRGTVIPQGRVFFDAASPAGMAFDDGGTNSVIGSNGGFDSDDLNQITVDTPINDDIDVFGVSLISDFDLGAVNLKLITAYRDQEAQSGQDFDGGAGPLLNQFVTSDQSQFSQEIQLTGATENGRFDWLAGAYYFEEEGQFISDVQLAGTQVDIDTNNKTTSYAAFAQGTYKLSDKLSVTGGLRYSEETKSVLIDTLFGDFPLVIAGQDEQSFSSFTPKASIEYQADDDLLVYASVAQGFRSGGFNGRPFSPTDLAPFDEETTTSYEVGFKSDFAGDKLRLNMAGFLSDYQDIQLTATTTDAMGAFIVITDNAGQIGLYGFEAELQAAPTDNLNFFGSVGFTNTDGLEPQAGFDFGSDILPLASEWTVSVGGDYSFPIRSSIEGTIAVDYAYRSSFFPQFNNSPRAKQDGYGLLNARFQIKPENTPWDLTLWGKNLGDETYRTFGQDSAVSGLPFVVGFFAPTREYGATLSFDFH